MAERRAKNKGPGLRPKSQKPSAPKPGLKSLPPRPEPAEPPELLAPAGSRASWAAAVENGADAVYLGLNDFSARSYADNFSLAECAAVIDESHAAGVRVYLAMNALIKEAELPLAFRLLAACAEMEPDGLIVQDLGLASLAAKYFPQLERHASTLMGVHSLPGLVTLAEAGFSRAVLARELAFDEVRALAEHSPIDLELFIHGALCFSFSGLCLMSSFLGGRSALRGGCTQPCRRLYQQAGRRGAFFSASDLCTAPYINELRRLPIRSFKIEGRMKGPDYVGRVTRAYRMLLDAPEAEWPYALAEAENILAQAPQRSSSGGLLAARLEGSPAPLGSTTSGLELGRMEPAGAGQGRVTLKRPLAVDDRLRLQIRPGQESEAFKLKSIILDGQPVDAAPAGASVTISGPKFPSEAGFLFKVSSGREEKEALASPLARRVKQKAQESSLAPSRALPTELKKRFPAQAQALDPARLPWWVWLNRAEDLRLLPPGEAGRIILPLSVPNARHIRHNRRRLKEWAGRLVWSLEPLVFLKRQLQLAKEAAALIEAGDGDFLISNLAHINLLQRAAGSLRLRLWGDHRLGVLNHLAEAALHKLGLTGICLSLEADAEAYRELWKSPAAGRRLLYFYGHPALFSSHFPLQVRPQAIVSPKGEKFHLAHEGSELIVTAERPVFMAPFLKMPPLAGAAGLIVDLREEARPAEKMRELKNAVHSARGAHGSSFNFKRQLL